LLRRLFYKVSAVIEGLAYDFKSMNIIAQKVRMQSKSKNEIGLWIGLDWADQKHDAYVVDAKGQGQHETFDQKVEAIESWLAEKQQQAQGKKIAILIEKSSNGIFHALMLREEVILYPINPKQFAKYRESYQNAGSKDDKSDARLMARMLCERHSVLQRLTVDDEQTRLLNQLCRNRRKLVDQRVKCEVRLKSHLKASFPLLLELGVGNHIIIALLKRWPDPRKIKRANTATLTAVLHEAGVRKETKTQSLIRQIRQSKLLTSDAAIHNAMAIMFKAQCRMIGELNKAIQQFDGEIEKAMKAHQDAALFTPLPGAGKALAPRILAAFGSDRQRYKNADEVAALTGIAPVTVQSGKSLHVKRRYACSNFLRQTFHEFAGYARIWCPWSKAYYQMQRNRGMKHHAALRKLAHRWIRILFRVWSNRTAYDQQKYIQSMIQKNPKILPFLDPKFKPNAA